MFYFVIEDILKFYLHFASQRKKNKSKLTFIFYFHDKLILSPFNEKNK